MNIFKWFRRTSAPRKFNYSDMPALERDMKSDRDYTEIYGDDLEAIAEAKRGWALAGQQVIDSTRQMLHYKNRKD